jgi:hypothetical protein
LLYKEALAGNKPGKKGKGKKKKWAETGKVTLSLYMQGVLTNEKK